MIRTAKNSRVRNAEEGASVAEFAILLPFLVLLLFGIIEFAWLFATNLDVRQGAREAARQAATDDFLNPGSPVADICGKLNLANRSSTNVSISRSGVTIGDGITVSVDAAAETLTGLLDWFIPSGTRFTSTVTLRLEQPPTWTTISTVNCP